MTDQLIDSIKRLSKAEDRVKLKSIERMWIKDTPKINVLNYWWYRYFTNSLELYMATLLLNFRSEK